MYRLDYVATIGTGTGEKSKSVSLVLPETCGIGHALAECANVLADQTYRLDNLALRELCHAMQDGKRVLAVYKTLLRYERGGHL